ncbi:MAG: spinster family MFS transporter [Isosphaeraceae bacterium]
MQLPDASGHGPGASAPPAAAELEKRAAARGASWWTWKVFLVVFMVNLLESIDRWLLPTLLRPLREELTLSDTEAGWLGTLLLLSYALWSPVVGFLADRFSRPRLMALGIAVWSLATVGTGLARSYTELQLARILVGIGGSTFGVIALALLMDLFPRGVRARVLSAYYLAIPLGAAIGLRLGWAIAEAGTWHTAFLLTGGPGLVLGLLALLLRDPLRGSSEPVPVDRLKLHEHLGPSREDYIDMMVNSSYTYSVFGLAFSMFAIAGLVFWLPTFLMVVHELPAERVSLWLAGLVPAAMVLGMMTGGWLADRYSRITPRALFVVPGIAMLASIPFLLLTVFGRSEKAIGLGLFATFTLLFCNTGPCHAIIASVVMPNMRAVACAGAITATHLLGDLLSPALMGWVADTFGQADSMDTSFGHALAAIGAVPKALPGHEPENLIAALLLAVPALLIAGAVLLAGARHLPREMALMLAKLRAAPRRALTARTLLGRSVAAPPELQES